MRCPAVEALAAFGVAALIAALGGHAASAATATPSPQPTLDYQKLNQRLKETNKAGQYVMPPSREPKEPQHTELIVETNKKGQVTRVRSGHGGPDPLFNIMVYGNALQAWIRTEDGQAIPGTYKLTYEYSPDTKMVTREVELVKAGGVNPDAIGAVDDMKEANEHRMELDRKIWESMNKTMATPTPAPK